MFAKFLVGTIRVKAKVSKLKLGLPVLFLLCALFFFAGLFVSRLLFQDLNDVGPRSRMLQESVAREYEALEHGKSGEPLIDSIPFHILSWRPRAVYFPNFTSVEVCERIIKMAKPRLEPSKLALQEGETAESTKGTRTSSGTFISVSEDKSGILDFLERKIAKLTMIPKSHGEEFNVLRYEVGHMYDSHYDAFNPDEYGPVRNQRDGLKIDTGYDYQKCIGLKVKPRQGDGLLFYSLFPDGKIDKVLNISADFSPWKLSSD